jgi:tetratricopeptide (TPR) repeat protein
VLFVITAVVYYPVHRYPFLLDIDDQAYVYANPRVLGPLDWQAVKWAFTHTYCLNYDPLTFLAHSINVKLFQLNPGPHHDVNVLLHFFDVLLLFWVLTRATACRGRSFMVAALFAVHPVNVENVAWISELKTMLSTGFFFLALDAYRRYARDLKFWRMIWVGFLFGLGLLAKPQVIALPFVLLLWDYWPLSRMFGSTDGSKAPKPGDRTFAPARLSGLVLEKMPLFSIAGIDIFLTLQSEQKDLERYTPLIRFGAAIRSYVVYLGKALWPTNLAFMYPHPGYGLRWTEVWAALALLFAMSCLVIAYRRHRYLVVGWFWFLGTMLPMINLVQIDLPAVADRYAYTCYIGLFLMVCWGAADWAQRQHLPRGLLPITGVVTVLILAVLSHRQVRYWKDSATVWTHSLAVTDDNSIADAGIRHIADESGQLDEALAELHRTYEAKPNDVRVMLDIAIIEHKHKQFYEAILYYQKALDASEDVKIRSQVLGNMGHAYGDVGDAAKAMECYRQAQRLSLR